MQIKNSKIDDLICNCVTCKRNGKSWSWYCKESIPNFIEISKNASSAVREKFKKNRIPYEKLSLDDSYFFIVRDPLDRFRSLIAHYFSKGRRREYGDLFLKSKKINHNIESIIDFVLDDFNCLNTIKDPHHWKSQCFFIPKKLADSNLIPINIKDVSDIFDLEVINSSDTENIKLSKNNIKKVKELYENDFTFYDCCMSNYNKKSIINQIGYYNNTTK